MRRLLVIYNHSSSNFCRVKSEVLDKLPKLKGYIICKYVIKKTNFDDNVNTLSKLIKDNDLVVSAGGDATAAVTMNAIIKSGKDATLSVLPYGNFNDFARTTSGPAQDHYYPLAIFVNGKLWRYASSYVTIGMMADAVEIFNSTKIRKKLQKGRRSHWRSYLYLASWYFKNRHQKTFLPDFTLNGQKPAKKASDYIAFNGSSMASIMKTAASFHDPKVFHSGVKYLTSFWRLFNFMTKSILRHVPCGETTLDSIKFANPSTITIQAEGEPRTFTNVKTIEVKKTNHHISITGEQLL